MTSNCTTGHYLQYKKNTSIFITWVVDTAHEIGDGHLRSTARLPNAESKNAASNSSSTRKVCIADFLYYAKCLSNRQNSALPIPLHVHRAALQAITARKSFTEWYRKLGAPVSEHEYFTEKLAEALACLIKDSTHDIDPNGISSCLEGATDDPWSNAERSKEMRGIPNTSREATLVRSKASGQKMPKVQRQAQAPLFTNRFELLGFESTLPANSDQEDVVQEFTSDETQCHPSDAYELEEQAESDLELSIFYFFEDCNAIRLRVRTVWDCFRRNEIDLRIASIITNIAVGKNSSRG